MRRTGAIADGPNWDLARPGRALPKHDKDYIWRWAARAVEVSPEEAGPGARLGAGKPCAVPMRGKFREQSHRSFSLAKTDLHGARWFKP